MAVPIRAACATPAGHTLEVMADEALARASARAHPQFGRGRIRIRDAIEIAYDDAMDAGNGGEQVVGSRSQIRRKPSPRPLAGMMKGRASCANSVRAWSCASDVGFDVRGEDGASLGMTVAFPKKVRLLGGRQSDCRLPGRCWSSSSSPSVGGWVARAPSFLLWRLDRLRVRLRCRRFVRLDGQHLLFWGRQRGAGVAKQESDFMILKCGRWRPP